MTCVMRSLSPSTMMPLSGMSASTSSPRSVIFFSIEMSTRRMLSHTSNGAFVRVRSRDWSCETSSMRRTRRDRRRASSEMMRRYSFSCSGGIVPSRMPSV